MVFEVCFFQTCHYSYNTAQTKPYFEFEVLLLYRVINMWKMRFLLLFFIRKFTLVRKIENQSFVLVRMFAFLKAVKR